jgi:hypothetical protein
MPWNHYLDSAMFAPFRTDEQTWHPECAAFAA